jgi:two-component system sensor histidine kinase/response regulator
VDREVPQPAALSVLLAEDNVVNQRVASALLGKIGHRVTVCGNGREAVQAVARGGFDLVLMDIQMPEMDGLAAAAAIRALPDPAKSQIPIYAISANVRDEEVANYRAHGITDILTKPLRPDRLRSLLENCAPTPAAAAQLLDEAQIAALKDALPPAKLAELFGIAEASLKDSAAALQEGWRTGDMAKVKAAAHRLAGVARNFGCLALGELAARIENEAARGEDSSGAAARTVELLAASLAALSRGN